MRVKTLLVFLVESPLCLLFSQINILEKTQLAIYTTKVSFPHNF